MTPAPSTLLENADVEVFTPTFAYARTLDLWGRSGKVDVVAPYNCMQGSVDLGDLGHERDTGAAP